MRDYRKKSRFNLSLQIRQIYLYFPTNFAKARNKDDHHPRVRFSHTMLPLYILSFGLREKIFPQPVLEVRSLGRLASTHEFRRRNIGCNRENNFIRVFSVCLAPFFALGDFSSRNSVEYSNAPNSSQSAFPSNARQLKANRRSSLF